MGEESGGGKEINNLSVEHTHGREREQGKFWGGGGGGLWGLITFPKNCFDILLFTFIS